MPTLISARNMGVVSLGLPHSSDSASYSGFEARNQDAVASRVGSKFVALLYNSVNPASVTVLLVLEIT
jgi:hypothetical protein